MSVKTFEISSDLWRRFSQPFFCLLFLYFFLVSAELFNFFVVIFKIRVNLFIGLLTVVLFFIRYRVLRIDRDFLAVALGCLGSMLLSALFGYFLAACAFFILLFVFNYLVFFVFPVNLFRVFEDSSWIIKLYFFSFIAVGCFATAQIIFSIFGVTLPGVTQHISAIKRGQGFSYEPSYYALYMTPFAMFQTVKFFLQDKKERKLWKVLGANILLLVSTSTGCLFSYIALVLCLGIFKVAKIIRNVSLTKIFWRSLAVLGAFFTSVWFVYPSLISSGFLKFFWHGVIYHWSFQDRWQGIVRYWNIFLDHPILGTGLGGATTYNAIKEGLSISSTDPMILEQGIAMNVTTEILGSLGLVGIFAFACFFWTLGKNCRTTIRLKEMTPEERINVISFIISLCVMFFALQFSQSIMRPYVWLHVGISVGYMKYLQSKYRRESCV